MDTCTPLYRIPYQTCDDRPCDFDTVACAQAEVIEANLTRLDTVANRTATTTPMVRAQNTVHDVLVDNNQPDNWAFDTVLVDTDNMFSSDQNTIFTVNTPGFYIINVQLQIAPVGTANVQNSIAAAFRLIPPLTSPVAEGISIMEHGVVFASIGAGSYVEMCMPTPLTSGTIVTAPRAFPLYVQDSLTVRLVDFSMFWVGDLP